MKSTPEQRAEILKQEFLNHAKPIRIIINVPLLGAHADLPLTDENLKQTFMVEPKVFDDGSLGWALQNTVKVGLWPRVGGVVEDQWPIAEIVNIQFNLDLVIPNERI